MFIFVFVCLYLYEKTACCLHQGTRALEGVGAMGSCCSCCRSSKEEDKAKRSEASPSHCFFLPSSTVDFSGFLHVSGVRSKTESSRKVRSFSDVHHLQTHFAVSDVPSTPSHRSVAPLDNYPLRIAVSSAGICRRWRQ